jgi:hypothetical protein
MLFITKIEAIQNGLPQSYTEKTCVYYYGGARGKIELPLCN